MIRALGIHEVHAYIESTRYVTFMCERGKRVDAN